MSESSTKDVPRDASGSTSPQTESRLTRENDPTETTRTEKNEEDSTRELQERENDSPQEEEEEEEEGETKVSDAPPLPDEVPPPLPNEAPPSEDDGWEPVWDANAQSYYFYNRYTGLSQWENPRVPNPAAAAPVVPAVPPARGTEDSIQRASSPPLGGYNPAIHGDYDPTAPYAQQYERQEEEAQVAPGTVNPAGYDAVGSFNRFTGRWQGESQNPEYHNDENKSRRQMNAYFDVDAAANSHDGRSLRAERSAKKLSKQELKMFKEKRREKKEEKRRAWLRD